MIYASFSKLSKELKNNIKILVSQEVLSYGSKQSKYSLIDNSRTTQPT